MFYLKSRWGSVYLSANTTAEASGNNLSKDRNQLDQSLGFTTSPLLKFQASRLEPTQRSKEGSQSGPFLSDLYSGHLPPFKLVLNEAICMYMISVAIFVYYFEIPVS
ncbi:hypothetical protein AYI69_g5733 [Smittium culicis]|uniref:Uncharacterized protein n=1 Tax=Smittium culicis TaxID=133412 RepID=A0A1R1Y3Z2_9FUNG|nr:hypothetical protein AYI69_g5733 [Smittium culicis]